MRRRMERGLARATGLLASRGVAPESVTLVALVVSLFAGIALAAGGVVREPRLWLLVPSLGLVRLVLYAVEARLVDFRPSIPRREEHVDGRW